MATVTWKQTAPTWVALIDDEPVCTLKGKDIGGWTASWHGDRLWQPPAHLPKASPQATRFFMDLAEAKAAVEEALGTA
ncbi:hypothetical protein KIK84_12470 [Curvibacter sp. CHRR-16]|uniref:hypothetical protein n=1 Tax=Curvibacter sp. CHRR-16 TaxID=2835872 RepID=UPI001BD9FDD5|nr:hypothetical protein [Curvibacter sp. CHRR-16]MBT0571143.1 hypothetical protein [Curvibacter sp. CHRR-16]